MMGLEEDPEDGPAVAVSVFIAVAIYGVRRCPSCLSSTLTLLRPFWSSAVSKHTSMCERAGKGQFHYDDAGRGATRMHRDTLIPGVYVWRSFWLILAYEKYNWDSRRWGAEGSEVNTGS